MTPTELETFISRRMSKSHIYQPAILTVLLENGGQASVKLIAERCAAVTGKTSEEFEKRLLKYPKDALTKSQVITVDAKTFHLSCPMSQLDTALVSRLLALSTAAMQRFAHS